MMFIKNSTHTNCVTRQVLSSHQELRLWLRRSISHLPAMTVSQELWPPRPDCLQLCSGAKVVFTVTRLSKGCTDRMSHSVGPMARQTEGDSCMQLQRVNKLQRQCFQAAAVQMSQWRPSRSVELEPRGLIVGHS